MEGSGGGGKEVSRDLVEASGSGHGPYDDDDEDHQRRNSVHGQYFVFFLIISYYHFLHWVSNRYIQLVSFILERWTTKKVI